MWSGADGWHGTGATGTVFPFQRGGIIPFEAWYNSAINPYFATNYFITAPDILEFSPILIGEKLTFDEMRIEIAAGTANPLDKVRIGIYDSLNKLPKNRIVDSGEIPVDVSAINDVAISEELTPGLYWLSIITNAAFGVGVNGLSASDIYNIVSTYASPFQNSGSKLRYAFPYAALPAVIDQTLLTSETGQVANICIKAAA
jgi:hypothetical protein